MNENAKPQRIETSDGGKGDRSRGGGGSATTRVGRKWKVEKQKGEWIRGGERE